jgi:1-acyl-sn-glycerol-3-phosphate acyltransferase
MATPNYLINFMMEIMRKYFRLQVEGLEHIPRRGGGIIAPNHSGFSGFDAMILSHEIFKETERTARVLTHHLWFVTKTTAVPAKKLGFIEATTKNGLDHLKRGHLIVLFPEGEFGNFKPTTKAYEVQEFKRGFVRMALTTGTPIIPTVIVGAEETHINLAQIKFTKFLRGTILPLPLNLIPLPAKWTIKFMKPIYLPYKPSAANDADLVRDIADEIHDQVQEALQKLTESRKSIF